MLQVNPLGTEKFLASGATPILMSCRLSIVINSNFVLIVRNVVTEDTDVNRFVLPNCSARMKSFHDRNARCDENLCDSQQDNVGKCACYQIPNFIGKVIANFELQVTL